MSVFRSFLVNQFAPVSVHFFFGAYLSERYLGFSHFVKRPVYKGKQNLSQKCPGANCPRESRKHAHTCAHTHTRLRAST